MVLLLALVLMLAGGVWAAIERSLPVVLLATGCIVLLIALHPSLAS